MKRVLHIIMIYASIACLCGCSTEAEMNTFAGNSDIRIQVGGTTQFVYDPLTCQISTSRSLRTFRASSDNLTDFFHAEFSEVPSYEGQKVTANLTWTTPRDIMSRKKLTLEVLRIEGEKVILWSKSGHIGLCIQSLE